MSAFSSRHLGSRSRWVLALTFGLSFCLSGCQPGVHAPPSDADVMAAEALRPAQAEVAALYERSCMSCHGVRGGAPLTGHGPSWEPRLAQGMDTLVKHTREGLRGMPAMGMCPDCSDRNFQDLIAFMSTPR
jgi:cytochrome c5